MTKTQFGAAMVFNLIQFLEEEFEYFDDGGEFKTKEDFETAINLKQDICDTIISKYGFYIEEEVNCEVAA